MHELIKLLFLRFQILKSYDNWDIQEPNNAGGENCVEIKQTKNQYKWNDLDCSLKRSYICQKPQGK